MSAWGAGAAALSGGIPKVARGTGRREGAVISHRHRCIYVKFPKCASTSVPEWFAAHGGGGPSFRLPILIQRSHRFSVK